MAKITIWGDFKADDTEHLNISGELQLLLNRSEINVVNFEAPVKSKGNAICKSGPNLCQSVYAPQWLEDHGFNMVSLANNHIMDYGVEGLNETLAKFNKTISVGAGLGDEAYNMKVVSTSDGLRIGFIAATHREFGVLTETSEGRGAAWCMHPDFERLIYSHSGG